MLWGLRSFLGVAHDGAEAGRHADREMAKAIRDHDYDVLLDREMMKLKTEMRELGEEM